MRLARPTRRTESETIVALIDVIFFLLVFFMLVGRMDATAPFEILPPLATSGTDMPAGGLVVSVGRDGQAALDGAAIGSAALEERLARLLSADPDLAVRLQAHAETELRFVLPMAARIEALGGRDVGFVVTPNPP